jgi:hypothetical protein
VSDRLVAEDEWAADMLYRPEPSLAPPTVSPSEQGAAESDQRPTESDADGAITELQSSAVQLDTSDTDAGAKKVARVFGMGVACAVAVSAVALTAFRDDAPRPQPPGPPTVLASPPAPQSASAAASDSDQAIPYTASANCPPGSTSAQALIDTTIDSAWVCVRGPQGATVDGQVLRVEFNGSYVVSAVTATPGWVAKTPGGKDEWLQHRVVTRLQYMFNDTDHTIVTQDTANTHGPVTTALRHKVLASKATVVVLQTSRPPASPLPTAGPDALGLNGFGDSMLGTDGAPLQPDSTSSTASLSLGDEVSDPVDATFAMSQLTFLGHEPN